jgi:hypothetical protein
MGTGEKGAGSRLSNSPTFIVQGEKRLVNKNVEALDKQIEVVNE